MTKKTKQVKLSDCVWHEKGWIQLRGYGVGLEDCLKCHVESKSTNLQVTFKENNLPIAFIICFSHLFHKSKNRCCNSFLKNYIQPLITLKSAVVHHILESHLRKVFCIDSLDMNYLEANKMKANIKQKKIYFFVCMKNHVDYQQEERQHRRWNPI